MPPRIRKTFPDAPPHRDAYTAALIDAKGHIGIEKSVRNGRAQHWLQITVNCPHPLLRSWIQLNYRRPGGGVVGSISAGRWKTRSKDAFALLQSVERYVVVKREQVEAAMRFLRHEDSLKSAKHTAAEIAVEMKYREEMLSHLSDLNQAHRRREEPTGVAVTPELAHLIKRDQRRENEEVIDRLNEAAEEVKRQMRPKVKPLDDRSA